MAKALVISNNAGRRYHTAPNEQITFRLSDVETSGQLDLAEIELGYLGGPPLHIHPEQDETHYILKGRLRYQIGEEAVEAKCGDCLYIPKGTPHTWINLQQETARILGILTPGGSEGFFQTVSSAPSDELDSASLAKLAQDYGAEIVGPPLAVSLGL
ncbi:MAG: cupin domain-containing protein [Leptolyngbyaceae cyanobacterium MO_188.B28]|nr:cupin domain-containing protein [Leptolyngbyaceae cyanobacterium MO_188.B28]